MGLQDTIRESLRGSANRHASTAVEDDEDQTDETTPDEDEDEENASTAETESTEDDEADDDAAEDDENKSKDAAKSARISERNRIKAILSSPHAEANANLAMEMAFETSMSSTEAIKLLKAGAKGGSKSSSLASRMASEKNPNLGSGAEADADETADNPEGRLLALAKNRKAQRTK